MQQSEQNHRDSAAVVADDIDQYIDRLSTFFDEAVQTASDDELFAQGYLRGHVDLAIGQLQVVAEPFAIIDIVERVNASLAAAVAGGELNEHDKTLVFSIWQQLH